MSLEKYQQIIEEMAVQQETELNEVKIANTRIRNIRMAAIINDYLMQVSGVGIIVTGGLAIEFYTEGGYTTQDIDFITPAERDLPKVLENLGFKKQGKYWEHEQLEIILELVANVPFDGIYKEPLLYETQDGYTVRFNDVNDMLMDRIRGLTQWKYQGYAKWILDLIERHKGELDLAYLREYLDTPADLATFETFYKMVVDADSLDSKINRLIMNLEDKDIHFTEGNDEEESYYLAFPLSNIAKDALGSYFGLQLLPKLKILLYNDGTDEFEITDVQNIISTIENLGKEYQEPFISLAEELKKEGV